MKYHFIKTAAVLFCAAVFISCSAKEDKPQDGKLNIAVSSYVPYSFAKSVLGDMADFTLLIAPGTEPHAFEPSPKTIKEIKQAQIFFYISNILEPWALKIDKRAVMLAVNLPQVIEKDPHVWMNFDNAKVMAKNLRDNIVKQHPDFEGKINQRYNAFVHEIDSLKTLYSKIMPTCKQRTIYHIGHLAFGYIARDYGLEFKALFAADMEQEPSAKEIALLVKEIKENDIKYIFSEEQLNPALANTISKETGAKILMLSSIENITKQEFAQDASYQSLMLAYLRNLAVGLNCKGE